MCIFTEKLSACGQAKLDALDKVGWWMAGGPGWRVSRAWRPWSSRKPGWRGRGAQASGNRTQRCTICLWPWIAVVSRECAGLQETEGLGFSSREEGYKPDPGRVCTPEPGLEHYGEGGQECWGFEAPCTASPLPSGYSASVQRPAHQSPCLTPPACLHMGEPAHAPGLLTALKGGWGGSLHPTSQGAQRAAGTISA